jgi:hypothetical protein
MNRLPAFVALALTCALCPLAQAQEASAPKDPATGIEPKVQYTVIEDEGARIEELRVRGQTQRITVKPKGMKPYEILPADQGRDMSDSAGSQRGAAGKRVWHILSF